MSISSATRKDSTSLRRAGMILLTDHSWQGLEVCSSKLGWVPINFTAFQVILYEQICKCLFFIYLLMHLSTHSLLQQIRAQHQLCGRGHTKCWRQQMEEGTASVPSMIQADSESQLCKHIIVVHSRNHEETGARCGGAQQRGHSHLPSIQTLKGSSTTLSVPRWIRATSSKEPALISSSSQIISH